IKVFSTKDHCIMCNEMLTLMTSVTSLSDKIKMDVCACDENSSEAKKYGIEHHPALVIESGKDFGIRFFGVPAGKEFTTLVESIMMVSNGQPTLPQKVLDILKEVDKEVNLKVFVTLDCPYCPAMVHKAHKFAMASDKITSEMIEASQFVDLATKFDIFGVPNTIINNGKRNIEGLTDDLTLVKQILLAIGKTGSTSPYL
ncbi:MAG: thioredoxin family protein, partial [Asgard group archaeon]|nr:thioredoxin family protein [Asgard group archaeon]